MIKYTDYAITFAEVPDEVSLCFSISNCGLHCPECHSPQLQKDIGEDLEKDLEEILDQYRGRITCVCFLGQGNDESALQRCASKCKQYQLKIALYTGREKRDMDWSIWDYIKLGSYQSTLGGLDKPTTNQRMYKQVNGEFMDITSRFLKKY